MQNCYLWTIDKKAYRNYLRQGKITLNRRLNKGKPAPKVGNLVKFNNFDALGEITSIRMMTDSHKINGFSIYKIEIGLCLKPEKDTTVAHDLNNFRLDGPIAGLNSGTDNNVYLGGLLSEALSVYGFLSLRQDIRSSNARLFEEFWAGAFPRCAIQSIEEETWRSPASHVIYLREATSKYRDSHEGPVVAAAILNDIPNGNLDIALYVADHPAWSKNFTLALKLYREVLKVIKPVINSNRCINILSGNEFNADHLIYSFYELYTPVRYKRNICF